MDVKPSSAILAALAAAQQATARPPAGVPGRSEGTVLAKAVSAARADGTAIGANPPRRERPLATPQDQRPPPLDRRLGRLVDITV